MPMHIIFLPVLKRSSDASEETRTSLTWCWGGGCRRLWGRSQVSFPASKVPFSVFMLCSYISAVTVVGCKMLFQTGAASDKGLFGLCHRCPHCHSRLELFGTEYQSWSLTNPTTRIPNSSVTQNVSQKSRVAGFRLTLRSGAAKF